MLGPHVEDFVGSESTARTGREREALLSAVGAVEELCNVGLTEPELGIVSVVVFAQIHAVRVACFPVSFRPVDRRLNVVDDVIESESVRL